MSHNPAKVLFPRDSEKLYFEVPGLVPDEAPVFHGFFGRSGGVSTDVYASLNCGIGSDDDPAAVHENRKRVAAAVGVATDHLLSVYQVHGDQCVSVEGPWAAQGRPEADAMVTDVPGVALGIMTADCAPVLFYGQKSDGSPVIAAAHAGWGGALKGILGATVQAMVTKGAQEGSIHAAIGPCIGQASYEVKEAFAEPFMAEDEANETFFMAGQRAGHLQFDLPGYCALKLAKAGLRRVYIKDLDTYFNEEDFYSYRRTTHREEKDYGRQLSVICIRGK